MLRSHCPFISQMLPWLSLCLGCCAQCTTGHPFCCHCGLSCFSPPTAQMASSFFFSLFFLGLHLLHMEFPRLGVELELQLLAYTTATATPDPSHVCDLHRRSQQCQILNPLSGARDQTLVFMDTSQVHSTKPQQELWHGHLY